MVDGDGEEEKAADAKEPKRDQKLRDLGRDIVEERPTFRMDGDKAIMTTGGVAFVPAPAPPPPPARPPAPAPPAPPPPVKAAEPAPRPPEPAPPPRPAPPSGPKFEPPPPPPPPLAPRPLPPIATPKNAPPAAGPPVDPKRPLPSQFAAKEATRGGGTRPGTNPGSGGQATSPGVASAPDVIAAEARNRPPIAVAIVKRGAQAPDQAFIEALLNADCPSILEQRVPTIGLTQRSWWSTEEALQAGAKQLVQSLAGEYGSVPEHATWHVSYGPGYAKVLLIFLRKTA